MSEIDKVDVNGNPILVDETVSLPKKDYDDMVEKLANETQSKASLVAEIKELREKKQLTEAEAADLKKKLEQRDVTPVDVKDLTPDKIAEIAMNTFKSVLAEKEQETAKSNRASAMTTFLSNHKEFHPDNDEGGLKLGVLERKLAQFNTNGVTSESGFLSILEDAAKLIGTTSVVTPESDPNPPAPNGTRDGSQVPSVVNDKLTSKELQIIERSFDGDRERYLKIKAKRPDYVATLLQYSL